jgi:HEAT repeat protein
MNGSNLQSRQLFNTIMDGHCESTQGTADCLICVIVGAELIFCWEWEMHMRALAVAIFTVAVPLVGVGADQPKKVEDLIKALGSGKPAEQLQAADDLEELGHMAKPAVPALIKALESNDAPLQWHAARALSALGSEAKDAVPALTKALKSPDPMVRGHAAHALEDIGEASQSAATELADMLDDKDGNVRRAAIDALVAIKLKPEKLVPVLKKAIEDNEGDPSLMVPALNLLAEQGEAGMAVLIEELKNPKGRYPATIAIGEFGPKAKAAVPDLTKFLADPNVEMRMQAAFTLGKIGPDAKSALPALTKALDDSHIPVQYGAAFALGKIAVKDKDAMAALSKKLDSKDGLLKISSAWALAKMDLQDKARYDSTVKTLAEALKDDNEHVRAVAAQGLLDLNPPRDVIAPILVGMMAEKNPVLRAHVADALASLGEAAVPRLIKALEKDDTQGLAVEVARRLGPKAKDAVPALILELKDPSADYRREVEFALAAIGPDAKAAVPALIEHLGTEEPQVRYIACYALGKIGPAARDAVPALQKNLAGDDKFLKAASVWALLHIQPEDKPLKVAAVPILIAGLKDAQTDLAKEEAAIALGSLNVPEAKAAIPELEKLTSESESPGVREAAEGALKKLKQMK